MDENPYQPVPTSSAGRSSMIRLGITVAFLICIATGFLAGLVVGHGWGWRDYDRLLIGDEAHAKKYGDDEFLSKVAR